MRIGNDTTSVNTGTASTNTRCEYKTNTPNNFDFIVFTCPSPGIIGKVITIQKYSGHEMRGHEVQIYGKSYFRKT